MEFRDMRQLMRLSSINEQGAALLEYILLAALVVVVSTVAITNVGAGTTDKFETVSKVLETTATNSDTPRSWGDPVTSDQITEISNAADSPATSHISWNTIESASLDWHIADQSSDLYTSLYDAMISGAIVEIPGYTTAEKTVEKTYNFVIIGINHPGDGGTITLMSCEGTGSEGTDYMQFGKYHSRTEKTSTGGWTAGTDNIRDYINGDGVYNRLKPEVQEKICASTKPYLTIYNDADSISYSSQNVFLLSAAEIYGEHATRGDSSNTFSDKHRHPIALEGTQYEYFSGLGIGPTNYSSLSKGAAFWLRSTGGANDGYYFSLSCADGHLGDWAADYQAGVAPAFSIG